MALFSVLRGKPTLQLDLHLACAQRWVFNHQLGAYECCHCGPRTSVDNHFLFPSASHQILRYQGHPVHDGLAYGRHRNRQLVYLVESAPARTPQARVGPREGLGRRQDGRLVGVNRPQRTGRRYYNSVAG